MEWIIIAIVSGLVATFLNTGCATGQQHLVKDCNVVIVGKSVEKINDEQVAGKPTGEELCVSATKWWEKW
jgi:hypothetical protein